MMIDKITRCIETKDRKEFETDKFHFRFFVKRLNTKGCKAHYVLNLTQDEEFNDFVAQPVTVIHSYLKEDEKWSALFR